MNRGGFPYGTAAWRKLRNQALRRDRARCIQCGSRERLTVNHIEPVQAHPERAWQLANLETLCAACDNAHHREKGHGGQPFGCDETGRPLDPAHPWNVSGPD